MTGENHIYTLIQKRNFDEVLEYLDDSAETTENKEKNVQYVNQSTEENILHHAAFHQAPKKVFKKLFEIGGEELFKKFEKHDKSKDTVLMKACGKVYPDTKTIDFLLMKAHERKKDCKGFLDYTSYLCQQEDAEKNNAFHLCCKHNKPLPGGNFILRKLISRVKENAGTFSQEAQPAPTDQTAKEVQKAKEAQKAQEAVFKLIMTKNEKGSIPLDILYFKKFEADEDDFEFHSGINDDIKFLFKKMEENKSADLKFDAYSILKKVHEMEYDITKDVVIQKLINAIYNSKKVVFINMCDLCAALFMVIFLPFGLTNLIADQDNQTVEALTIVFMALSLVWMICRELLSLMVFGDDRKAQLLTYFSNPFNYVDIAQIIFGLWTLIVAILHDTGNLSSLSQFVLMITTAIAWLRVIFVIGQLSYTVSVFSTSLIQIMISLVPFLSVTAVSLFAFAHLQFISESQQSDSNLYIADLYISNLIAILTATFEFKNETTYDATFVIQIMFAFLIGILLLNILIAVISNDFTEVMNNSKRILLKNRLKFLLELNPKGGLEWSGKPRKALFSFLEEEVDETEIDLLMGMTARYQSQIVKLQKEMENCKDEMKKCNQEMNNCKEEMKNATKAPGQRPPNSNSQQEGKDE